MENPTISKEVLFEDCVVGDVDSLRRLLQNPAYVAKALETEEFVDDEEHGFTHPRLNLDVMLEQACRAGSTDVVKSLLSFAKAHEVPYEELIRRDSICGAIGSDSALAIFEALLTVHPDVVDIHIGLVGTPLGQAVGGSNNLPLYTGERAPLVQFLLEHGADPNRIINPTGTYLQNAVIRASVGIIELLLQHGAKIAQSGAMHAAAESGRLDVMNILLEHGADVNEQLAGDISFSASYRARKKKEKSIISDITDDLCNRGRKTKEYVVTSNVLDYGKKEWNHETPLHYSVLSGQVDATKWLVLHGADANVKDSKGWSARDMATKIGNAGLLEALRLEAKSTTD